MKKVLSWCWSKIKKPWIQFVCILLLVGGYWTWDVTVFHNEERTEVQMEVIEDTTRYSIPELLEDSTIVMPHLPEAMMSPPDDSVEEEESRESISIPDDVDEMSDREYRLYLWDMVLGHLDSILASVAALLTPLITWWVQRKNNNG